jgi:hypothetical protein
VDDEAVAKFLHRALRSQSLQLIGYSRAEFDAGVIDWDGITPSEYWALDERCVGELLMTRIASPYVKEFIRRDGERVAVRVFECWELFEPQIGVTIAVELAERLP